MKQTSLKKNFIYNLMYQLLVLIVPIVVSPYLSRVIGASGIGIYSYTYSIVYYFMILTLLGINNYGNRTIAKVRNDSKKLSKTFWSIYVFQLTLGLFMVFLYLIYIFLFDISYFQIATIEILFIISAILDINWFYFGLEEFKVTITRNAIVKVGTLLLIFIFVKAEQDLWKYTLIMAGTTCFSQGMLWGILWKRITFVKITWDDVKKHIKPNLVLFFPVIAISLYKIMDKIMLGNISGVVEVGYYENAEKIVNIPLTFISALGTVMLPRISNILSKRKEDTSKKVEDYIFKSIQFVMFMAFIMCFGLIATGYHFAPLFFGEGFQKVGILIMLLAITLPFLFFASVLRTQYLIPNEQDKIYIISVSLGAIVNLILNCMLIPTLGSVGACIGTIFAEFMVMFYQALSLRKYLNIRKYVYSIIPFFIKAFVTFIIIYPFNFLEMNSLLRLIVQIGIGGSIYGLLNFRFVLSIIYKNNLK